MKVLWKRDAGLLTYDRTDGTEITIPVSCIVRNEINGLRNVLEAPVYTENKDATKGKPYMPRAFPKGLWHIVAMLRKIDPYEAPYFVSTDAHQSVTVWSEVYSQNDNRTVHYGIPLREQIEDYGYGFHDSISLSTLGCGRHNTDNVCADAVPGTHETFEGRLFRTYVKLALEDGPIPLEVV
jgi:hypothetical protein